MKSTKSILVLGLLLCNTVIVQSQAFFRTDISTQGIGLGVVFAPEEGSHGFSVVSFPENFRGVGLGVESPLFSTGNDSKNKLIIAPRLSYECHLSFLPVFLGGRLNTLYYTDFEKGSFVIRPEIGVTSRGNIYLFYGYNFAFQETTLVPSKHQITIGFTIPRTQ